MEEDEPNIHSRNASFSTGEQYDASMKPASFSYCTHGCSFMYALTWSAFWKTSLLKQPGWNSCRSFMSGTLSVSVHATRPDWSAYISRCRLSRHSFCALSHFAQKYMGMPKMRISHKKNIHRPPFETPFRAVSQDMFSVYRRAGRILSQKNYLTIKRWYIIYAEAYCLIESNSAAFFLCSSSRSYRF